MKGKPQDTNRNAHRKHRPPKLKDYSRRTNLFLRMLREQDARKAS